MDFTPRQLAAIDISKLGRDMCVVAGPGSGKTTVLVERFRRLVREAGISPARILAITFTEKAATNMKAKLAEALRDRPEDRRRLERGWVSTVHGFCLRLLRENAIYAGLDPEFRVMDERQAATLQATAAREALDALYAESPAPFQGLMQGLASADPGGPLLEIYDAVRASGRPLGTLLDFEAPPCLGFDDLLAMVPAIERPAGWSESQRAELDQVLAWGQTHAHLRGQPASLAHFDALRNFDCNLNRLKRNNGTYERVREIKDGMDDVRRRLLTEYYASERDLLAEALLHFDRAYRERKRALASLDYADLEDAAVRLLERDAGVRERVRAQFDQVLMDEFQDTNGLQAKLLGLVRPPDRFYAVGDINQSIYGFRHAEPEVFHRYREEIERGGKPLAELTENWRSRPEILRAVRTILHGAGGIEERPLLAAKEFPEKAAPSVEVLVAACDDAVQALELEARWVAHRILELEGALALRERVAGFGDIAVLVRNSEVLPAFTRAFDECGVPYLVSRGKGFYEAREVVDLTHLLRVLVNPRDEISMAAVLRSPLVGVSDEALLRLKITGNLGAALRRREITGMDPADLEKLDRFRAQLREWRAARDYTSFDRLLLRAIDDAGYPYEPGSRAAANIEKFLAIAREAAGRLSLAEFVEELELTRASDPREPDAAPEDSAHAVRILTVHAAKGLEFPMVFLAALHKGIDTSLGNLSFSPRLGLGVRWRDPATGDEKDDLFQHAIREERKKRESDEADRLFYVAMTRAEEHLVLSCSGAGAPKNWAEILAKGLQLNLQPDDLERTLVMRSPDGESFSVLVRCTSRSPEKLSRAGVSQEREAPPELPRPAVTDQYDSNATVTSVVLFGNCPRQYYLQRYLGWDLRDPAGPGAGAGLPAGEFGTQVHTLLAGLEVADPVPEAMRLAGRFRASPLGRRAARAARVEREFDFLMAREDVVLRGQIDLWFEDSGRLVLVDYKTDNVSSAEAAAHAESYAVQLRLYALALEGIAGRLPDEAYVYLLRPDVAVPVDLAPLYLHAAERLVADFRDAQSSLRFPLNEGERCRRCPYFHGLCPSAAP